MSTLCRCYLHSMWIYVDVLSVLYRFYVDSDFFSSDSTKIRHGFEMLDADWT